MLFTETVEPRTLSILKRLMDLKIMRDAALVGGTALSLKFGHRISTDLDIFFSSKVTNEEIIDAVHTEFKHSFTVRNPKIAIGVFGHIEDVKVDFVRYLHPIIRPLEIYDGIKMYSNQDILAMKIQAILGRAKKKDFWDIYELLKIFSIHETIELHRMKYPTQILPIGIQYAMIHFIDAEEDQDPVSLQGQTWQQIKKDIAKKVNNYLLK